MTEPIVFALIAAVALVLALVVWRRAQRSARRRKRSQPQVKIDLMKRG